MSRLWVFRLIDVSDHYHQWTYLITIVFLYSKRVQLFVMPIKLWICIPFWPKSVHGSLGYLSRLLSIYYDVTASDGLPRDVNLLINLIRRENTQLVCFPKLLHFKVILTARSLRAVSCHLLFCFKINKVRDSFVKIFKTEYSI